MSRIGKKIVNVPQNVTVELTANMIKVSGPNGQLDRPLHKDVKILKTEEGITVEPVNSTKGARQKWGLMRTLIDNMVVGSVTKFEKKLELQGVGFKFNIAPTKITLNLGFSHPIEMDIPKGVEVSDDKENKTQLILVVKGMDKQAVGQFAAKIRALKPVEPYKGKGFRYLGERVIRKAGKSAAK